MGVLSLPDTQSSDPQPWRILELKGSEHLLWSEQSPQPPASPPGEFEGLSGEVHCLGHMDRTVREEQGDSGFQ